MAEQLHISDILNKYPYEISGGEKQRCACARAIINGPDLVLADEPTGSLDSTATIMLLECMEEMNKKLDSTLVVVTHDVFVAARTKRVLFMKDGTIYGELKKDDRNHEQYLAEIMNKVSRIGGSHIF